MTAPTYWHTAGEILTRSADGSITFLPLNRGRELISFYRVEEHDATDANDMAAANHCLRMQMQLISAVSDCERWREASKPRAMTLRDAAEIVYPPQFHNVIQFRKGAV